VPSTRRGTAGGKSARSAQSASAKSRARERIAAERAARKRAETHRRFLLSGAAVVAVLAIVGAFVGFNLSGAHPAARESQAASVVVQQATAVPLGVLTRVSQGQAATPLQQVTAAGPTLRVNGKPTIVFVSEESCPFCAAERWPLVVALSHFGTWNNLGSTRSSATDVYPNTATFSFRAAHFRSAEITLRTTELADNTGRPLQPETALDARLISAYDVPPFVNSADQSGAVPFLDIANHYILAGAQYNPQILAGLSAAQIASQLRNPSSPVAQAIDGSARVIVTAIDQVLHGTPTGSASRS
jgi:type II secretory pathway pseudopilin PulG